MKKVILLPFIIIIQVSLVFAQKIIPLTTPEAAGFSSERLKRLDREMNEWAQKEWMNGGVALVIHNGKVAYYKAAGYDDLDSKSALQKDGIFRIASQTKAITSVAMMMLFEEGKFQLDDQVSKFIPAFKKQQVLDKFNAADTTYTTVPAKSEITIRQLFTHTSGLGYAQIGSKEANAIYAKNNLTAGIGVKDDNLLAAMNRLGKLPLMHQPGEKWTYGLNSDLLGCLVEVISGMTLNDFKEKNKTATVSPFTENDFRIEVKEDLNAGNEYNTVTYYFDNENNKPLYEMIIEYKSEKLLNDYCQLKLKAPNTDDGKWKWTTKEGYVFKAWTFGKKLVFVLALPSTEWEEK